jgi:hypothetical protein
MMRISAFFFIFSLATLPVHAQNLMEERIWKIAPRKKSIFLDSGVFHHHAKSKATITGIRNSITSGQGYERVVIDFNTPSIPKIYGNISSANQKLSIDLFETAVGVDQTQLKKSNFVKGIDFINVDGKSLTLEINLKSKASFDIFYLETPGRLVIDIR